MEKKKYVRPVILCYLMTRVAKGIKQRFWEIPLFKLRQFTFPSVCPLSFRLWPVSGIPSADLNVSYLDYPDRFLIADPRMVRRNRPLSTRCGPS